MALSDDIKPAREAAAVFALARDSMQGAWTWSFTKKRSVLPKLSSTPVGPYSLEFQLPNEALRIIQVGQHYVGVDLTNYRGFPVEEFSIEGRRILTNISDPLDLLFCQRVTDTTQFPSTFITAFAGELAAMLAEPLTQSDTKRDRAEKYRDRQIKLAIRANAIELSPVLLADDSWILSRR